MTNKLSEVNMKQSEFQTKKKYRSYCDLTAINKNESARKIEINIIGKMVDYDF